MVSNGDREGDFEARSARRFNAGLPWSADSHARCRKVAPLIRDISTPRATIADSVQLEIDTHLLPRFPEAGGAQWQSAGILE